MKYKFIPVDNDINKAIAFANSLDQNNVKNVQKIKGIQLDFEQANSNAFQQVSTQLKDDIIPEFVNRFIME